MKFFKKLFKLVCNSFAFYSPEIVPRNPQDFNSFLPKEKTEEEERYEKSYLSKHLREIGFVCTSLSSMLDCDITYKFNPKRYSFDFFKGEEEILYIRLEGENCQANEVYVYHNMREEEYLKGMFSSIFVYRSPTSKYKFKIIIELTKELTRII